MSLPMNPSKKDNSHRASAVTPRLHVRDRLRTLTDERRWREYARSQVSIFYRVQPLR